ncbi:(4Fe-4S)-binding protein [Aureicoccus marinus]|uniref:Iron-binding zinc finger CDGSH type domain-containing protein n=1 Tax=Aureicoccus marinus TaxID=754435 RepID=A0A2S7T4H6_9FLAO|nr:(4Fe-4S)-binding protein [Aureicoccus marinus]PQJ14366.1 hypothetical protein BST99_00130 [Aureicoccus marinus]
MAEIVKDYTKGDLTIHWKPAKCIHSEICIKTLPEVYKPSEKPWIQPEGASEEDLMKQIDRCPSAALTYIRKGQDAQEVVSNTEIEIMVNGPLLVKGNIRLVRKGETEEKEGPVALCRCGESANKPFCDGAHKRIDFQG